MNGGELQRHASSLHEQDANRDQSRRDAETHGSNDCDAFLRATEIDGGQECSDGRRTWHEPAGSSHSRQGPESEWILSLRQLDLMGVTVMPAVIVLMPMLVRMGMRVGMRVDVSVIVRMFSRVNVRGMLVRVAMILVSPPTKQPECREHHPDSDGQNEGCGDDLEPEGRRRIRLSGRVAERNQSEKEDDDHVGDSHHESEKVRVPNTAPGGDEVSAHDRLTVPGL